MARENDPYAFEQFLFMLGAVQGALWQVPFRQRFIACLADQHVENGITFWVRALRDELTACLQGAGVEDEP